MAGQPKRVTNIMKIMKKKNIKSIDLAKQTGLLKSNISRITSGRQTNYHVSTLQKLCKALKCKSIDILGW